MPSKVFPKEGEVFYSHLEIEDCGIKECCYDGKRVHHHTLNPRGKAMKEVEQTVYRALLIIEAFDEIVKRWGTDGDWTVVTPATYRKIFGEFNSTTSLLPELWDRYRTRSLHRDVLGLAESLVLEDLAADKRKEIKRGIKRISEELAG